MLLRKLAAVGTLGLTGFRYVTADSNNALRACASDIGEKLHPKFDSCIKRSPEQDCYQQIVPLAALDESYCEHVVDIHGNMHDQINDFFSGVRDGLDKARKKKASKEKTRTSTRNLKGPQTKAIPKQPIATTTKKPTKTKSQDSTITPMIQYFVL